MRTPCKLHETITPSAHLVRYWWHRFNRELFKGRLLHPVVQVHTEAESALSCGGNTWGWYWPNESAGEGQVSIWATPQTRRHFLATMIHEMVHQEQHMLGLPLVHGRYFKVACLYYGRKVGIPVT